MTRYLGKVCVKHPELKGERREGHCAGCEKERRRAGSQERISRWRAANREKAAATAKSWRAANVGRNATTCRAWKAANPGKKKAIDQSWRAANPEKCAAQKANRRARKLNLSVPLNPAEKARYVALFAEARRLTKETGELHTVDHDKPLARGGLDHPDNMHVLPARINFAKGARYASTLEFILS